MKICYTTYKTHVINNPQPHEHYGIVWSGSREQQPVSLETQEKDDHSQTPLTRWEKSCRSIRQLFNNKFNLLSFSTCRKKSHITTWLCCEQLYFIKLHQSACRASICPQGGAVVNLISSSTVGQKHPTKEVKTFVQITVVPKQTQREVDCRIVKSYF